MGVILFPYSEKVQPRCQIHIELGRILFAGEWFVASAGAPSAPHPKSGTNLRCLHTLFIRNAVRSPASHLPGLDEIGAHERPLPRTRHFPRTRKSMGRERSSEGNTRTPSWPSRSPLAYGATGESLWPLLRLVCSEKRRSRRRRVTAPSGLALPKPWQPSSDQSRSVLPFRPSTINGCGVKTSHGSWTASSWYGGSMKGGCTGAPVSLGGLRSGTPRSSSRFPTNVSLGRARRAPPMPAS